MTTLTVTTTTDYRNPPNSSQVTGQNRTILSYSGSPGTTINATFNASQFGGSNMSNTLQLSGRGALDVDQISVVLASAGSFSAAGWSFTNWFVSDVVLFEGSLGDDSIIGSSRNDEFRGSQGADTLRGGSGDDVFTYLGQNDVASGEVVDGGSGIDAIRTPVNTALDLRPINLVDVEELRISQGGTVTLGGNQIGPYSGILNTVVGSLQANTVEMLRMVSNGSVALDLRNVTFQNWVVDQDVIDFQGSSVADVMFGSAQKEFFAASTGNDLVVGHGFMPQSLVFGSGLVQRPAGTNNGTTATALSLNNAWSLGANSDIAAATALPHVTVNAAGDSLNIRHVYSLTLAAGQFVLIDLDAPGFFDSVLRLSDPSGLLVALGDDSSASIGGGGSTSGVNSFIGYVAMTTGTYHIEVGGFGGSGSVPANTPYTLHVSTGFTSTTSPSPAGLSDTISGELGSDTLIGGAGHDVFEGGAGPDIMLGGDGNDVFTVSDSAHLIGDSIDGGDGFDQLLVNGTIATNGQAQFRSIEGIRFVGSSTLTVLAREFGTFGLNPFVRLSKAGPLENTLRIEVENTPGGFDARDFVIDASWLDGGVVVIANVSSLPVSLIGTSGRDSLDGSASLALDETLNGWDGNDTIRGLAGNDLLFGGLGNDLLGGGAGNDTLWGGAGEESLYGGDGDDILLGEQDYDAISGGNGNDLLYGWESGDLLEGGDGADTLFGEQDNDILSGGNGADLLWGGIGFDTLYGDEGSDVLLGEQGEDVLWGGNGNDLLYGWEWNDTLLGENGDDTLFGEQDNDVLYGWFGNDVLWGGLGFDTLWGEQDNDVLLGEQGEDQLHGGDGNDTLYGWEWNDTLMGDAGDDVLYGEQDNDNLNGGAGNDVLWGGTGHDVMRGLDGDDTFIGGLGRDTMTGGAGADRFFNAFFEMAAGEVDLIVDYDAADSYHFQTGAVLNYFNFNAPGYGVGAGIHVTLPGGVYILDVFGATAAQLQAQTQFF